MRKDRILKLADTIEKCENWDGQEEAGLHLDNCFTMEFVEFDCGTPACLMGWVTYLFGGTIEQALGIHNFQGDHLAVPDNRHAYWAAEPGSSRHISAKRAAAVLRNLVDTGKVDWRIGYEERQDS